MSRRLPHIRIPVSLRRLFPLASFVGCADIRVAEATERSQECSPNVLFAAITGTRVDGCGYVGEAIKRGAQALLVQRPLADVPIPQCVVPNVRKAYAEICSALANDPSRNLRLAGVTGTNGKTTVTWLVRSILQAADHQTGLLGTIEYHDGLNATPSTLTTPDSRTLSEMLRMMLERGTTHAALEMSSHALDQHRCAGTKIDAAVVTNITQDHFDYHGTFGDYLNSKAKIVEHCKQDGVVILNEDNAGSIMLRGLIGDQQPVITYGVERPGHFSAQVLEESLSGTRFLLKTPGECCEIETSLVGRHNVSNCLAAAATAIHLGASLDAVQRGIASLASVPGRLERVECGQPFELFVDYAHTDDALRRCVGYLRQLAAGRVICVFGAGGDRDRTKRPLMAQAASGADLAVVTSDNPRTENPHRIIEEIVRGFPPAGADWHVECDRAAAISWAIEQALPGDCILVAGKGHESQQIVGDRRLPFDDREVAKLALLRHLADVDTVKTKVRA